MRWSSSGRRLRPDSPAASATDATAPKGIPMNAEHAALREAIAQCESDVISASESHDHGKMEQIGQAFGKLRAAIATQRELTDTPRPTQQEVARIGDMAQRDALRVGLDGDGDAYISTTNQQAGVEFCTTGSGGGKSPRTHQALIELMVAIEADNTADPSRDWWARRNSPPTVERQESEG